MADEKKQPKEAPDTREADRKRELSIQEQIVKAVHDATHDKAGNPTPIVAEFPTGVKAFGGEKAK